MWNLLQRIIGKSSPRQEWLMNRLGRNKAIASITIDKAVELIRPLGKPSFDLDLNTDNNYQLPTSVSKKDKTKRFPFYGTVEAQGYQWFLYVDLKKAGRDSNFIDVIAGSHGEATNSELQRTSYPMWESIIHLDTVIHHKLVALAPTRPWTLYKLAKQKITATTGFNKYLGYPQWLVNDIDYRDIKDSEFLFQVEIPDIEGVIFVFIDKRDDSTQIFLQKM